MRCGWKNNRCRCFEEEEAENHVISGEAEPVVPLRPPSAYFLFVRETRDAVAKEFPGRVGDMASKLNEMWDCLDPAEKKGYFVEAESLQQEYKKQMLAYSAGSSCKR